MNKGINPEFVKTLEILYENLLSYVKPNMKESSKMSGIIIFE